MVRNGSFGLKSEEVSYQLPTIIMETEIVQMEINVDHLSNKMFKELDIPIHLLLLFKIF